MSLSVSNSVPTPIAEGGTGQITKSAAFDALSPMSAVGDMILGGTSGSGTRVAIGTAKKVWQSDGTTASWAALGNNWSSVARGDASHIAGKVAGTYALTTGGNPSAVSGTGTLYPQALIRIDSADYATVNGGTVLFRVKTSLLVNDVGLTGTLIYGLYPVTRPATSGGAGLNILSLGTVVASSTATFTNPAADSMASVTSSTFALPADGYYVLGFITNATVAVSSLFWCYAELQVSNA